MIDIGFFICPGHEMLDLAGPHCAFQSAVAPSGGRAYRLHVLSSAGGAVRNNAGFGVDTAPADGATVDTLIMVGGAIAPMLDQREGEAFAAVAQRARRVASVCTGAFMLAELGLLARPHQVDLVRPDRLGKVVSEQRGMLVTPSAELLDPVGENGVQPASPRLFRRLA